MAVKTKKHLETKHNKRNKYNKKKTRKNRKIGGKEFDIRVINSISRQLVKWVIKDVTKKLKKGQNLKDVIKDKYFKQIMKIEEYNESGKILVRDLLFAIGSHPNKKKSKDLYEEIEKFIKLLQKHKYDFPSRDSLLNGINNMFTMNIWDMDDNEIKYKIKFAELLLKIKPERPIEIDRGFMCYNDYVICNLLSANSSKNNDLKSLEKTNRVFFKSLFDPEKDREDFVLRIKKEELLEKNPNFLGVKDSKNNLELALQGQIDNPTKDYSEVLEFILRSAKNADISQKLYVPSVVKLLTDNIEIFKKYPEVVKRLLDDANRLKLKSLLELLEEKAEPEKEDIDTDQ